MTGPRRTAHDARNSNDPIDHLEIEVEKSATYGSYLPSLSGDHAVGNRCVGSREWRRPAAIETSKQAAMNAKP